MLLKTIFTVCPTKFGRIYSVLLIFGINIWNVSFPFSFLLKKKVGEKVCRGGGSLACHPSSQCPCMYILKFKENFCKSGKLLPASEILPTGHKVHKNA
jgi:hypothetical protein